MTMINDLRRWWRSREPLDPDLEESIAWLLIIVAVFTLLLIG